MFLTYLNHYNLHLTRNNIHAEVKVTFSEGHDILETKLLLLSTNNLVSLLSNSFIHIRINCYFIR